MIAPVILACSSSNYSLLCTPSVHQSLLQYSYQCCCASYHHCCDVEMVALLPFGFCVLSIMLANTISILSHPRSPSQDHGDRHRIELTTCQPSYAGCLPSCNPKKPHLILKNAPGETVVPDRLGGFGDAINKISLSCLYTSGPSILQQSQGHKNYIQTRQCVSVPGAVLKVLYKWNGCRSKRHS